eukprot:CAMPEP_0119278994 /NCGR_PEP_ID=MMETSP1329-20130426/20062_1 /TAXON_ID=114041 /ORGANISM="Genus nov. species nov., Strain RCC1024" /LENGTH=71 /DNA_ID=CAMNT_0007279523 /DNA_START=66 /DNA_END=278 /DNA_ORIENTATION=-
MDAPLQETTAALAAAAARGDAAARERLEQRDDDAVAAFVARVLAEPAANPTYEAEFPALRSPAPRRKRAAL